jgi:restriction system protein
MGAGVFVLVQGMNASSTRPHRMGVSKNLAGHGSRTRQRGAMRIAWWAWLLLGGALYFALQATHTYVSAGEAARSTISVAVDVGAIAALVACTILSAITFMLGRNSSPARGSKRIAHVAPTNSHEVRMSWGQFELLAVEAFRRRGFQITERGSSSDDGSRNLQLTRGRQRFIAHCKAWRQSVVDIGAVRELYSIIIVSKADGGFVITTGAFTQEARTFAAGRQLQLIDGPTLRELLRDAEGHPTVMPTVIPTGIVEPPPTAQH